jgi:OmcA/MtrC family decaheme c-type cytochrome
VTVTFHGRGRIGFDACIACHGAAATGDRPQYVAPNAPATDGVTISFRELIHKAHMGADLENAATYEVVGFGNTAYPNNFGVVTFEHIHFPAFPAGVKACATCHGEGSQAWLAPQDTNHPTEQVNPGQPWSLVCGSCHDGAAAHAHIDAQTSPSGAESCAICHGDGQQWAVDTMHMRR